MKLFVGLFIGLILCVVPTRGQNPICTGLQDLFTEFGDSLFGYLSESGLECVATLKPPTPVPLGEPIWSASGSSNDRQSVSLELLPGTYDLNLERLVPFYNSFDDSSRIELEDAISDPDDCFVWESLDFPSTVRIEQPCRIFATLKAFSPRHSWDVTITKSETGLPTFPLADGWSTSGWGDRRFAVQVLFEPGIFRISFEQKGDNNWRELLYLEDVDPRGCLPVSSTTDLPTQFRVEHDCRVQAAIFMDGKSWELYISKLD